MCIRDSGDDLCPTTAGLIAARGCPDLPPALEQTTTTTPAVTGNSVTGNSVSAADQQILDRAMEKVAFNSNSSTLTPASQEILIEVAGVLKRYPGAVLEIRGHTDSSGPAAANMQLSMERARASASFISNQGIDITRLVSYGFGETQPIGRNDTAAGRRSNRRVEFDLKFNR